MKIKLDKKILINIYTIPAMLLTLLNIIVFFTDFEAITLTVLILNLTFWISGILLYKNKNFASLFAITGIILMFLNMANSSNLWVDPYYLCGILIMFYLISDLVIFFRKEYVKKIYKNICKLIIIFILLISTIFAVVDYNLIVDNKMPKFMIALTKEDTSGEPIYKWEFIGLGYKMTLNNSHGLNKIEDSEIDFRNWFYLFGIKLNTINDVVDIIDKVKEENLACAEAIDYFYEDRDNLYYFDCLKRDKIIVVYEDGTVKSFNDSFLSEINLEDLDKFNINYMSEKRISSLGEISNIDILEDYANIEFIINYDNDDYLDLISDGYLPYTLKNNSDGVVYGYDESFIIEKEQNGEWYELVPPNSFHFNEPYYSLKTIENELLDYKEIYGDLEPGDYRLIKEFNLDNDKFNLAVEFEIK